MGSTHGQARHSLVAFVLGVVPAILGADAPVINLLEVAGSHAKWGLVSDPGQVGHGARGGSPWSRRAGREVLTMIDTPLPRGVEDEKDLAKLKKLEETMSAVQGCVKELGRRMDWLPTVDQEGHSNVPHAENEYARKEKAARELGWKLNELRPYLDIVNRVSQRHRKELAVVKEHRARLHGEETVKEYDRAAHDLEVAIERLEAKREAVEELIQEAEEALRLASQRKWPLGEPEERMHFPNPFGNPDVRIEPGPRFPSAPAPGPALPGVCPGRASPSLGEGLGGLISKGPVI